MPHLPPLANHEAPPAARKLFDRIQAAFGMVPNIYRTLAHAPAVLEATLAFEKALAGELPARFRELAYLHSSRLNGCDY